jgi:hypothetical protein
MSRNTYIEMYFVIEGQDEKIADDIHSGNEVVETVVAFAIVRLVHIQTSPLYLAWAGILEHCD